MLSSSPASLPLLWDFILLIWSTSVYPNWVVSVALCCAALISNICELSLLHHVGCFFSFALLQPWRKLKPEVKLKISHSPPLWSIYCAFNSSWDCCGHVAYHLVWCLSSLLLLVALNAWHFGPECHDFRSEPFIFAWIYSRKYKEFRSEIMALEPKVSSIKNNKMQQRW